MPIALPNRGMIPASAQSAIPFPTPQRALAVDAIARYLAYLKKLPETRLAVCESVGGSIHPADRPRYCYARLGGAGGERIEAELLNLSEPRDGDTLLVRRDNPAGAGTWVVLDVFANHLRVCEDRRFWINLGQNALFEVTRVGATDAAGEIIFHTETGIMDWIIGSSRNKIYAAFEGLIADASNPPEWQVGLYNTTISSTFVATYSNTIDLYLTDLLGVSHWQLWSQDLSNGEVFYATVAPTLVMQHNAPSSWAADQIFPPRTTGVSIAAARHNNTDGLHFVRTLTGTVRAFLYSKTGFQLEEYVFPSGTFPDDRPYRACVKYGNPDLVFILPYDTVGNVFKLEWSTKTVTDLGSWYSGSSYASTHKQILSTRAGTLLILDSWDDPHLVVWRSTDDGATWTAVDLTAMIPSPAPVSGLNNYDYIAIAADNVLAIPVVGSAPSYLGYLLYSQDDGVTWTQTNAFIPCGDYGFPLDFCANGFEV